MLPDDFIRDRSVFVTGLSECDCVHIQYEPSFFLQGRCDFYPGLCKRIRVKKIVTLHEIYRKIPGIFPRENIRGTWPGRAIKEVLWDRRHPHWAAFERHRRGLFFADALVVHSQFQKDILTEKGFDKEKITVIPLPIKPRTKIKPPVDDPEKGIVLGATGFINPMYDYDLLFNVLGRLSGMWRFFWVGGLRRSDDEDLLRRLEHEIDNRGWKQRFTITGWVPDEDRDRLLDEMNIFLRVFQGAEFIREPCRRHCRGKADHRDVHSLTMEMASYGPLVLLAPDGPEKTAETISALVSDRGRLRSMEQAAAAYGRKYSYEECGRKTIHLYERVIAE